MKRQKRLTKRERKDLEEGTRILLELAPKRGYQAELLIAEFVDWVYSRKR